MQLKYHARVAAQLEAAPLVIRAAFKRKDKLLAQNIKHPSLHAKKYDEANDIWQARITKQWRFYFQIEGDTYTILSVTAHPK